MDESQEWMADFLAGDPQAFDRLYQRWHAELYRFLYLFLKPSVHVGLQQSAEDLTQDAFLEAMKHADRFDPNVADFRPWLFGIARHLALDFLRRKRPSQQPDQWARADATSSGRNPSDSAARRDALDRLLSFCQNDLDERERAFFFLWEKGLGVLPELAAEQALALADSLAAGHRAQAEKVGGKDISALAGALKQTDIAKVFGVCNAVVSRIRRQVESKLGQVLQT
jgi:RNA polymerase sigma factor (sigma-70 family)